MIDYILLKRDSNVIMSICCNKNEPFNFLRTLRRESEYEYNSSYSITMGIYSSGNIFGIRIYTMNATDDCINTLFEQTYNTIMSDEQKKEAYLFYTELGNENELCFTIYTECSSTHDTHNKTPFMIWHPISLTLFLEKFNV